MVKGGGAVIFAEQKTTAKTNKRDMAETEQNKSRRDAYLERLKKKYPDREFASDDEIFGQASDDYDQYEQEIGSLKGNQEALSKMFSEDPRSAQLLIDMHEGKDPVLGLVRHFGVEIRDVLDDPEMQDKIAEANKEYVERMAKSRELDSEYEKNFEKTLETLRDYQEKKGLSDDDVDKIVDALLTIVQDGVMGKFEASTLDMMAKAMNYDTDVANAGEEGRVAGRNDQIVERLRKREQGDGVAALGGKNSRGGRGKRDIFSLAQEAM